MPVEPCPVRESIAISSVNRPLGDIGIEVFVFIELNRNSVEPFEIHLTHPAVDHEPVVGVRQIVPNYDFVFTFVEVRVVISHIHLT